MVICPLLTGCLVMRGHIKILVKLILKRFLHVVLPFLLEFIGICYLNEHLMLNRLSRNYKYYSVNLMWILIYGYLLRFLYYL